MLRQTRLPSELLHKGNRNIKVRIGSPITVKEQSGFEDIMHFGQYLRARVYSLGSAIEVKKFSMQRTRHRIFKPEPIVERVPAGILREEFDRIRINYELFSSKNYSVIGPAEKILNILMK